MNLNQMLLVMLAAILFSSMIISLYSGMAIQSEMAEKNLYQSQGIKISSHIFQTFETQLIGGELSFEELYELLNQTGGLQMDPIHIDGAKYFPHVKSQYSDISGTSIHLPPGESSPYQRLDVVIKVEAMNREFYIGTENDPLQKVFSL